MKKDFGYYLATWGYQFGILALFFCITTLFGGDFDLETKICAGASIVCYIALEIFIYFKDKDAKNTTD